VGLKLLQVLLVWMFSGSGDGNKACFYAISLADTSVEMPERFKMGGFFAIRRRKKHT